MKKVIFFSLLFLIGACGNPNASSEEANDSKSEAVVAEEKLWDEVMVVHDEVMPRMSDISRIRRNLNGYLEVNPDLEEGLKGEIENTITYLDKGDEGMMSWMNNLKQLADLRKSQDHDAIMSYLEEEMEKITIVKEDMLGSISQGDALLKKLENEANPEEEE